MAISSGVGGRVAIARGSEKRNREGDSRSSGVEYMPG
jgi:hypothetical protein